MKDPLETINSLLSLDLVQTIKCDEFQLPRLDLKDPQGRRKFYLIRSECQELAEAFLAAAEMLK